jgi:NADH:ubiquinone oxidoreductase subunit 4 (subunit M)
MVFKIIAYLIPFLKEMVFGKKEDQIKDSPGVRLKKRIVFAILISSIFLNGLFFKRLYYVSVSNAARNDQIKKFEEEKKNYEEIRKNYDDSVKKAQQLDETLKFCISQKQK